MHGDLDSWRAWQLSRAPWNRRVRARVAPGNSDRPLWITSWAEDRRFDILLALDSLAPSQQAALVEPLRRLQTRGARIAVLHPRAVPELLPGASVAIGPFMSSMLRDRTPSELKLVVSAGDYMAVGAAAFSLAQFRDLPYLVIQHGVLTPHAPPLPSETILLAWSTDDLAFWADGRSDVTGAAVGAQILWQARSERDRVAPAARAGRRVTFLGQLHGAELPRAATRRSVATLKKDTAVRYLPHPGETDFASTLQHRAWQLRGVEVLARRPLVDLGGPVVAHFSTGVLEAAALGTPAFAFCAEPPTWLREFWQRYGMSEWGSNEPTKISLPQVEPAEAIADQIEARLK